MELGVEPVELAEDGGTAEVTVGTGTGSTYASEQEVTLLLSGTATEAEDYTISATTLTLPAGAGTEASRVTAVVTGVDDEVYEGAETVEVSGEVGGEAFGEAMALTIEDDEAAPVVTLVLGPESVREARGVSRVTATVAPAAGEGFTVTVAAVAVAPGGAGDFTLSGSELTFAANATASTGEVRITAVDNGVDAADRRVRVTGTASRPEIAAPEAVTLTIEDDDEAVNEPPEVVGSLTDQELAVGEKRRGWMCRECSRAGRERS